MFRNYLTVAYRNLLKNRLYTIINIVGLASGLACFILIAFYVADELSFDKFNEKADRIYRIHSMIRMGGTDLKLAVTSDPMGAALKKDYPQVEEFTRIYNSNGSKLIKKGNTFINETNVCHADSTFFNVFTLPAVEGNTRTALDKPNTVVISESAAKKYFGTTDVVGRSIETNEKNGTLYKITAVIKDIPRNSHFHFDFIFSMANVDYGFGNYLSHNFFTYLLLKPGTDYKAFEKNFTTYIDKYVFPQVNQFMHVATMQDFEKSGNKLHYELMPLTKIHLYSDLFPELSANGSIQYVYIFAAVALFVLLLACVNFINLSTARSANRAKEVGIRKVLGTERRALVRQFLTESTLTAVIATIIAVVIAWLVLPYFNDLSGKQMAFRDLFSGKVIPLLVLLPLIVGFIAGSYPAFYLSSFNPVSVLKGHIASGAKSSKLRSSLVVFQFTTSIVLIVSTIVVYKQLHYIQTKKLGFDKEQLLVIDGTNVLGNSTEAFKNEIAKLPGVTDATFAGFLPVSASAHTNNSYSKEAVFNPKTGFNMETWRIDYDYVKTLGMEIKEGRNFSKDFGTDSSAVIINETTAAILGYDEPIGKKIYSMAIMPSGPPIPYTIIGVVKNFHFESLKQKVAPLCFLLGKSDWAMAFKVKTNDIAFLVKQIESRWKEMAPSMPFSYRFLDESFDEMYRAEQRVGEVALSFAIIAILIACLGLFGLATFMAEQRTKEIGVRKVLGASVQNIAAMLSADFLKLLFFASFIAFPLAWWAMHTWLENFAYRADMSWWVFAVAGIATIVIALISVSYQAIRAAVSNPVKSLRTE